MLSPQLWMHISAPCSGSTPGRACNPLLLGRFAAAPPPHVVHIHMQQQKHPDTSIRPRTLCTRAIRTASNFTRFFCHSTNMRTAVLLCLVAAVHAHFLDVEPVQVPCCVLRLLWRCCASHLNANACATRGRYAIVAHACLKSKAGCLGVDTLLTFTGRGASLSILCIRQTVCDFQERASRMVCIVRFLGAV